MKHVVTALALLAAVPGAAGAQFFGNDSPAPNWGPNGNGTLDHPDDVTWIMFHNAKVTADDARGIYTASFPPSLVKQDGKFFSISGYMLPVDTKTVSPHFVLTRRSTGCPFCPPNEPTEAIEVFASRPIAYTQAPVRIEGTLHLVAHSEKGLFFRLDTASVG